MRGVDNVQAAYLDMKAIRLSGVWIGDEEIQRKKELKAILEQGVVNKPRNQGKITKDYGKERGKNDSGD